MKKLLLLTVLCLFVAFTLFPQESKADEYVYSIMFNPFFAVFDLISISYQISLLIIDIENQFLINDKFSFYLGIAFLSEFEDYNLVLKPMLIFRPAHTGQKGFFCGLYSNIEWLYYSPNYSKSTNNFFIGFGFNLGYKWIFNNGFSLQLGTGIGTTFHPYNYNFIISPDGRIRFELFDYQILDLKIGHSFMKKK